MRYGISAGALIVQDNRVLLVNHVEKERYDFWVPPGGRLKGEESIFECARRETLEETGLSVDLGRIIYIEEFVEPGHHSCKFFIECTAHRGNITLENREVDESFLVDVRFFTQDQLETLTVYPEIMRGQFWDDLRAGFPQTKYLGLGRVEV